MNTITTSDMPQSIKKQSNQFARGAIINGKRVEHWRADDPSIDAPLRWRKPRRIFVNSTSDLFHEAVPDEWIDRVFAVMALAPHHTFQVLTKRPERAREYSLGLNCDGARRYNVATAAENLANNFPIWDGHSYRLWDVYAGNEWDTKVTSVLQNPPWPLPNVWLGTSVEDQATADARIPHLLATPAAVRFVSAEPLLGPVDLRNMSRVIAPGLGESLDALTGESAQQSSIFGGSFLTHDASDDADWESYGPRLDWVICGGESGPGARPMHPDWARSLRDQCVAAGVPFFFKQWGEWAPRYDGAGREHATRVGKKAAGRLLDSRTWDQFPEVQT